MECVICRRGTTSPGEATVVFERRECVVVIRGVPAQVCANCGEYYLDEPTATAVLERAEQVLRAGAEITVQRYAA